MTPKRDATKNPELPLEVSEPVFRFQEEGHRYTVDGVELHSVTTVLNSCGLGIMADVWYQQRGTAVHLACELHDLDDLDPDSLDPTIAPFHEAYLTFLEEYKPAWGLPGLESGIEVPLWHKRWRYAGTIDRVGTILLAGQHKAVVLDLKAGAFDRSHALQLAAYSHLLPEGETMFERVGLYLHKDGTFNLKVFPYRELFADFRVFLSCLNLHVWKNSA